MRDTGSHGTGRNPAAAAVVLIVACGLAGGCAAPFHLPGARFAPVAPPPPAFGIAELSALHAQYALPSMDWFENVKRFDARSLLGPDRRMKLPVPPGVSFFSYAGEDVPVILVPDAIAAWGPASLAYDGDELLPGMKNTHSVGHDGFDTLRSGGIFVGDTMPGMQSEALCALRDCVDRHVGVPALVPVVGAPCDEWPAVVLTPEIIVRIDEDQLLATCEPTREDAIHALTERWGAESIEESPYVPGLFVIRAAGFEPAEWLRVAQRVRDEAACGGTANLNLLVPHVEDEDPVPDPAPVVNDPLFPRQWHLEETGVVDAWTRSGPNTMGSPDVVVAIIELYGVQISHPDLEENARGQAHRNFSTNLPLGTPDPDLRGTLNDAGKLVRDSTDGTATAGLAVGRGNNGIGISGVAPECGLMAIATGVGTPEADVLAIDHAWKNGAAVISCSWSLGKGNNVSDALRCAIQRATMLGRGGKGCVVLFSLTNKNTNNFTVPPLGPLGNQSCQIESEADSATPFQTVREGGESIVRGVSGLWEWRPIASLAAVMAIGRATDARVWGRCGFGRGMSLLGPGESTVANDKKQCDPAAPPAGNAGITTTDLSRPKTGNNWGGLSGPCPCRTDGPRQTKDGSYDTCFKGTSAATPIVAGVAALVISENPELRGDEVRDILERTADRIEPESADYRREAGRGLLYSETHGFGFVNAFEAVQEARRRRLLDKVALEFETSKPSGAVAGQPFVLALTVRNIGGLPAEDVVVTNVIPAGSSIIDTYPEDAALNESRTEIVWLLEPLAPGDEADLTITLICRADATGDLENRATATARDAETLESVVTLTLGAPPAESPAPASGE